jgi:site-specific DNA-methyltransferase (adenine-specific)
LPNMLTVSSMKKNQIPENEVIWGDVIPTLQRLPPECISLCMFSPPYYQQRDYKVDGQIGLEKTYQEWLDKMWAVMDEIWRVMRPDGTVWVNLGDKYGGSGCSSGHTSETMNLGRRTKDYGASKGIQKLTKGSEKSLLFLPEHFAIGCLERGWIARNKIIWNKQNPMPCSAKDRFTNTWEHLFFFTKSKKYWFDLDAVRRPHASINELRYPSRRKESKKFPLFGQKNITGNTSGWNPAGANPGDVIHAEERSITTREKEMVEFFEQRGSGGNPGYGIQGSSLGETHPAGANPGDVITDPTDFWSIPTQPTKLAHYASYPDRLCLTPLKAGCPRWICKQCGKPRVRVTKQTKEFTSGSGKSGKVPKGKYEGSEQAISGDYDIRMGPQVTHHTLGWSFCSCLCPVCGEADCKCGAKWRPGIVLDPFCGTGKTLLVAKMLGLSYIGIDIKKEYCEMAEHDLKYGSLLEPKKVEKVQQQGEMF